MPLIGSATVVVTSFENRFNPLAAHFSPMTIRLSQMTAEIHLTRAQFSGLTGEIAQMTARSPCKPSVEEA